MSTAMAMPANYKPSPLGYGSPRSSPFRRPESPVSPSPLRQTTPAASPSKETPGGGSTLTPSARFAATTPVLSSSNSWTSRNTHAPAPHTPLQSAADLTSEDRGSGGTRTGSRTTTPTRGSGAFSMMAQGSALSQLQPAQVRTLRDGFQILDRDGDGAVGREDVADMLNQLATPADVARFFPPAAAQTITVGAFLNGIATSLAALSPSTELLSALSAFDEDDSGQIDVAELRDALRYTAPESGEQALTETEINRVMQGFVGRRAFTKASVSGMGIGGGGGGGGFGKRGEVFKYQDFVQSIAGSGQDAAGEDEATE